MADSDTLPAEMNPTGLTDDQCKEVHSFFIRGTTYWVVIAAVAHMLVWSWLPWFPGAS